MIANDPLSLMFVACFAIGLLFLLIIAFSGHGHGHSLAHHAGGATSHIGHAGHTPLAHATHGPHASTPTGHSTSQVANHNAHGSHLSLFAIVNPLNIVLFLLGFGFFGYITSATKAFALPLTIVLASAGGLIIALALITILNRAFGNATGTTIQDVSDRTGLLGKVIMTIPQEGIGEIIYVSPGGMRKSIPARSIDGRRLEREQEVVVINDSAGIVEVDTWEHFISQEASNSASTGEGTKIRPHSNDMATLRALLDDVD
jgi:hypothetical protein